MLAYNADVNARTEVEDGENYTPLHLSALHGHVEVCRALISRNADAAARSRCDAMPLVVRPHDDIRLSRAALQSRPHSPQSCHNTRTHVRRDRIPAQRWRSRMSAVNKTCFMCVRLRLVWANRGPNVHQELYMKQLISSVQDIGLSKVYCTELCSAMRWWPCD